MEFESSVLAKLLEMLPEFAGHHGPTSGFHALMKHVVRKEVEELFAEGSEGERDFACFGEIVFPYHSMGAVDTLNLFDLDELIIFSFYWTNRARYERVADIGANLGLHTIILSRCGFEVRSYEPDPVHYELLQKNCSANGCSNATTFNAAVSTEAGTGEFIRVMGNTSGSHLAGAKPNPYGELEKFPVALEACTSVWSWADLVKVDAEGHEKDILLAIGKEQWNDTDAIVEVGSADNAEAIYSHFSQMGFKLFAQKVNWKKVAKLDQMPTSYRDGTLFITAKEQMTWN